MIIVILCGGRGRRLMPFTEETPKTLVPLNGKPLLDYNLELFSSKKLNNFILCIGYKGEKIREHIKKMQNSTPYNVTFSDAGKNASMLKRIYKLKEEVREMTLVIYGDTLTNIDVNDFKNHHINKGKAVSIVVASIQNPFGLVTFNEEGVAESFQEKPYLNYYIGMFLLSKSAFDYIDDQMLKEPDGEGLVSFFKRLIDEKQLMVYHYTGKQITFNTHREKEIAEEVIKTFITL